MMIGVLLPKADPQTEDAADALAIAVCHAHHRTSAVLKVARHDRQAQGHRRCIRQDYIILDVGGVGYQVYCSARTLQSLPPPGQPATLSIETHVREDQIRLFDSRASWSANGSACCRPCRGSAPRSPCLCSRHAEGFRTRVCSRDARQGHGGAAPGVGPKGAERIVHRAQGQGADLCECRSRLWCTLQARSDENAHHDR